jgi:hypothetical protein
MLAKLLLASLLASQIIVNEPSPDASLINFPASLSNDVVVCTQFRTDVACIRLGDLRQFLRTRKFAH